MTTSTSTSLTVVVPCYRSRETIPRLVEQLLAEVSPTACALVSSLQILLVVDGSPDDTADVARALEVKHPAVEAITLRRNYGQHNATLAGIRAATGDVVVTCDDDLQHRPSDIPVLLAPILDGEADLVYGVSEVEEHGALRSFASRLVKRSLATAGVPDARSISALRAFRTDLRRGFDHTEDPFVSIDVFLSWTTTKVVAVTIRMEERETGRSNYRIGALVQHAMNLITGYSTVPLRIVTWLGFATALFGIALGLVVIYRFFIGDTTVAGFTTTACLIALFASAQMVSLGIIGEYLGRVHVRGMQRPQYVVLEHDPGDVRVIPPVAQVSRDDEQTA